jgi:hypothetical protein
MRVLMCIALSNSESLADDQIDFFSNTCGTTKSLFWVCSALQLIPPTDTDQVRMQSRPENSQHKNFLKLICYMSHFSHAMAMANYRTVEQSASSPPIVCESITTLPTEIIEEMI